jgi:hypothetical protein
MESAMSIPSLIYGNVGAIQLVCFLLQVNLTLIVIEALASWKLPRWTAWRTPDCRKLSSIPTRFETLPDA